MPSTRRSQYFRPTGQSLLSDVTTIQAVLELGKQQPHDSTIKRSGDKFRIRQGGGATLAAPSVADGGAAEFDVAISGSGPWDVSVTWSGAGLAALAKGTTTRTITVTSVGATNSPLSIPVKLIVL
jgi:hypothetical protein